MTAPALTQDEIAINRIKEDEDAVKLARDLGLDVTLHWRPNYALSLFALVRTVIEERKKLFGPRRTWITGTLCFWWGVFCHWMIFS